MRFNEALTFNEDSEFNAILLTHLDPKRVGKITAPIPPYIWLWRDDSTTKDPRRRVEAVRCHYLRNKAVADAHYHNMPYDRYCGMVARTCIDAYYALNIRELPEGLREMKRDFRRWYLERKQAFWDCDLKTLREAKAVSRSEYLTDTWGRVPALTGYDGTVDESVTVHQWLEQLEKEESD